MKMGTKEVIDGVNLCWIVVLVELLLQRSQIENEYHKEKIKNPAAALFVLINFEQASCLPRYLFQNEAALKKGNV